MNNEGYRKSDKLLVICAGVLIAVLRYIVKDYQYVDKVVGTVTIFAFDYVIWIIVNDAYQRISIMTKKENVFSERNTSKKIKILKRRKNIFEGITFVPISILFIYICNSVYNDMLSFFSLCISIASDYIVDCIVDNYHN